MFRHGNATPNQSALVQAGGESGARLHPWQWIAVAVVVFVLVALAAIAYVADFSVMESHETLTESIRSLGMWGWAAIIGLMIIHCFVPFPAEFVAFAAGACFGLVTGTALTWIGAMLGASLSFGLTRWLGRPFVDAVLPPRHQRQLDRWTQDQGAATLLVSRFIPIISFNLINYAAGLTRVSLWTFLWTTGLGVLPLTTLMVYMGVRMQDLSWQWLLALSIAGIAVMAALHYGLRRRNRA